MNFKIHESLFISYFLQQKASTDSSSNLPPTRKTSSTDKAHEGISDETSESNITNSAAIAVPVVLLLVALVLAIGFFVYYKRRKR